MSRPLLPRDHIYEAVGMKLIRRLALCHNADKLATRLAYRNLLLCPCLMQKGLCRPLDYQEESATGVLIGEFAHPNTKVWGGIGVCGSANAESLSIPSTSPHGWLRAPLTELYCQKERESDIWEFHA